MTKTYAATFKNGRTYTRTTDAEYAHATYRDGRVAFHGTAAAARRRGGEVVAVRRVVGATERRMVVETARVADRIEAVAAVYHPPTTCTVTVAAGRSCGEPAVTTFTSSSGRVYGECAGHRVG